MDENSRFLPNTATTTPRPHVYTQKARQSHDEDILLDSYIEKEYKKIIISSGRRKLDKGWRRFIGLVFTVLSAICTASVFLLINVLNGTTTESRISGRPRDGGQRQRFDSQNIVLWSFGVTFVLAAPIFICSLCFRTFRTNATTHHPHGMCPCPCSRATERPGQCKDWILLLISGILCWAAFILRFSSIDYLSTYETAGLLYVEPLLLSIIAYSCVTDGRCGVLSVLGAGLVLAAAVTFAWSTTRKRDEWHTKLLLGIGLGIGSILCHTATTTILRIIRTVHFSLLLAYTGLVGFISTLSSFLVYGELTLPTEPKDILLLSGLGALVFGALFFFVLGLKYEQAVVVSIVLSLEIIFLHLGEVAFFDADFTEFRIIGESTVFICVLLMVVRKYVITRPQDGTGQSRSNCCYNVPM